MAGAGREVDGSDSVSRVRFSRDQDETRRNPQRS